VPLTQGSKNDTEIVFKKWALAKMAEIGILRFSYTEFGLVGLIN
jgi:hypothetical protein